MQLAGRTFTMVTDTLLDQDVYVMKRLRQTGLAESVTTFDPAKDNLSKFAEKVLIESLDSGLIWEILAGCLVEPGVPWTRDVAQQNAVFFSRLTAMEDKRTLYGEIGTVLVDFLVSVAKSNVPSPKSSLPPDSDGSVSPSARKTSRRSTGAHTGAR